MKYEFVFYYSLLVVIVLQRQAFLACAVFIHYLTKLKVQMTSDCLLQLRFIL